MAENNTATFDTATFEDTRRFAALYSKLPGHKKAAVIAFMTGMEAEKEITEMMRKNEGQ